MGTDKTSPLDTLTETVIGSAFTVSNTLGHGFLENIYKNALTEELEVRGYGSPRESPIRSSIAARRWDYMWRIWWSRTG